MPRQAGFTLLEMLIVLAVLGLGLGLVVTRGATRSQTFEMQAAVNEVTQAVRLARSKAIATNSPVRFAMDMASGSFRIDGGVPTVLPPWLHVSMATSSDEAYEGQVAIRFYGDGSATGGRIELTDGHRRAQVGVEWLTGRVSVIQPQ